MMLTKFMMRKNLEMIQILVSYFLGYLRMELFRVKAEPIPMSDSFCITSYGSMWKFGLSFVDYLGKLLIHSNSILGNTWYRNRTIYVKANTSWTFPECFWWGLMTITTVGYDINPNVSYQLFSGKSLQELEALTGIPILAVFQNLRWNSNKASLCTFLCQILTILRNRQPFLI